MKSCPACQRTFEDTFTFCLVDGSILSAPFDPQAAPADPVKRNKVSVPTEVLPTNAFDAHNPAASTWPSQAPAPTVSAYPKDLPNWAAPAVNYPPHPSAPGQRLIEPSSRRNFLLLYTLMRFLYSAIGITLWYLLIPPYPANDESIAKYGFIVILRSAVLGLLLGAAQAALLRKWITAAKSWILYTVAGYVLAAVLGLVFLQVLRAWSQTYNDWALFISEVYVIVTTLVAWTVPLFSQTLILRKYAHAAAWWIIVGIAAAVLDYATFKLFPLGNDSLASASIDVFRNGLTMGLLQATCLLNLRKKPTAVNLMQR